MDIRIKLDESQRDRMLILTLIHARVNEFILARILAQLNQLTDEEIQNKMQRWKFEERDLLLSQIERAAKDDLLNSLLGSNPRPET